MGDLEAENQRLTSGMVYVEKEMEILRRRLEEKQEIIDSLQSQVSDLKGQLRAADQVAKGVGKARDMIVEKYNRLMMHVNKAAKELNEGCSVRHLAEPFRG